jgi:hypothetical protein
VESGLVAGSHCPEYPPFDSDDLSLFRRQSRIEIAIQRPAAVCPLQPRRYSVGGLLVSVSAFPWKPPCPQGRVHLRHDRLALRNLPAVERPEVKWALALVPQIARIPERMARAKRLMTSPASLPRI